MKSNINENPEEYFTDEIMQQLEVAVGKEFKYGSAVEDEEIKVENEITEGFNWKITC